MTNYFKMHNYCKFYCKMFIVTTAITREGFHRLANQNRGHIRVMLEFLFLFNKIMTCFPYLCCKIDKKPKHAEFTSTGEFTSLALR